MKKILSTAIAATFVVIAYPTLADDVKGVKKAIDKAKDWSKKASDDAANWSKKAADDATKATKKAADDTADAVKKAGK
jgi:hypothetical protein